MRRILSILWDVSAVLVSLGDTQEPTGGAQSLSHGSKGWKLRVRGVETSGGTRSKEDDWESL